MTLLPKNTSEAPPPPPHTYIFFGAGFSPVVAIFFASEQTRAPVKCRRGTRDFVVVPCPSQSLVSLVLLTDWAIPWQLSSGPAVGFDGSPCQQTERHQRERTELCTAVGTDVDSILNTVQRVDSGPRTFFSPFG